MVHDTRSTAKEQLSILLHQTVGHNNTSMSQLDLELAIWLALYFQDLLDDL